jgi:group I intron endonuclease
MSVSNSGIYGIYCSANNKWYIGQTSNFYNRKFTHFHLLNNQKSNKHLQNSYNKYGKDTFSFIILEEIVLDNLSNSEKKTILTQSENKWMEEYDSIKNGFNIRLSAQSNIGLKFSDEVKRKISESLTGKSHSEETKRKISEAKKGRYVSEETRVKLSKAGKGKSLSEETKRKISEAQKGKLHSEETKLKMSETLKSKPLSEETKRKISEAKKGKSLSEETKRKISEAKKGKLFSEETKRKMSEARNRYIANLKQISI